MMSLSYIILNCFQFKIILFMQTLDLKLGFCISGFLESTMHRSDLNSSTMAAFRFGMLGDWDGLNFKLKFWVEGVISN